MSKSKEKKIKKLKTKHIWPSAVIFATTILFIFVLVIVCISLFITYVFENKYDAAYKQGLYVANNIEKRLSAGMDFNEAIEKKEFAERDLDNIYILDKNNKIIFSTTDNAINLENKGSMYYESHEFYFDISENRNWLDEDGNLSIKLWPIIKSVYYSGQNYSNEADWMNELIVTAKINMIVPFNYKDYSLIIPTTLKIYRSDLFLFIAIAAIFIILSAIPLIFMLVNIISNVKMQKQLRNLVYLDTLTGGKNANYFVEEGQRLLGKGRNKSKTFAIVDLEFMKFRSFCSCCGTAEGERTLEKIYTMINSTLKKSEIVSRYSRANFALLIECSDSEHAKARISSFLDKANELTINHRTIFHAGYYMLMPDSPAVRKLLDIKELYNYAGAARAAATDITENSIIPFSEDLLTSQRWQHKVEDEMARALENEEFQVYYQPKYNPVSEELAGAEALIRWLSPSDGLIPPGKFIPIFEENGFITKIDDYMISHVAKQQAAWLKEGKKIVPVSVNVSRAHFAQENLAEHILSLVDAHEVPHKYIEIELTESAFFDDKNQLLGTILKLKEYGFEISMDDFGAGYSSLNSLKELPLDVLKLDADFFRGAPEAEDRARLIVAEAISLAKQLKMRIVAEGIEKQEHVDFLAEIGCDMIQGYYFAKPMPASDYESRMDETT